MLSSSLTFFSFFRRRPSRVFVDASSFNPSRHDKSQKVVVLTVRNEEDTIFARVKREMAFGAKVVVLDLYSQDSTPYHAARAGAIVVLAAEEQSEESALEHALEIARRIAGRGQVQLC